MMSKLAIIASMLHERLQAKEDQLVIVDCRFQLGQPSSGRSAYEASHIPGAMYLDLEQDLSGPKSPDGRGGRHPLPDAEELARKLSAVGIGQTTSVVAYDDQGGAMASRLLWLLQWAGHQGEAALLAGGFAGWQAAGCEVTSEVPAARPASFKADVRSGLVVDAAYVREQAGQAGVTLVDSREAPRYRGEQEPIDPVAGHIPGAVNRFWKDSFAENGTFKDAASQEARFPGVGKDDEVIVYCGSGVTATPNVLALQSAGYRNVKLYAGSWSDWVSYSLNPVAVGDEEAPSGE
ncbi:sulfurtransferase [Paenibacillus sp. GCM10023252]|uniref:sulfurtransferase n=1 Tax=Paenibacillus sp. GCM10023252 TaxID=3252649 RepID=UPI00360C6573